jgi:hypothetical protein
VALFCVVALTVASAPAAQPAGEDALRAHLAAGEFGPALALARQAANPQQRDAMLAQVALAQAQAGARDAGLRSTAEIQNDLARSQALAAMNAQPMGAAGGAAQADFDSLIDLITSTIRPSTWDAAGGPGSIQRFPTGIYVDAQGVLRPLMKQETTSRLADLRTTSTAKNHQDSARRDSKLRMISLPRLEKHVQLRLASGREPTEEMQVLAGLQRIEYVFVYPESGDVVIAGPAGDWKADAEDHVVSTATGGPVVRLDDLVVVLRHMLGSKQAEFGCLITPKPENLAKLQEYLAESSKRKLTPEGRRAWLEAMRSRVGKQDIEVFGLDPNTRAARVMVEADYRMKLVGMGLEQGVPGVKSYLASIQVGPGEKPPAMGVLRWWFELNYDAVTASQDRRAFEFRGQGVCVKSENERLAAQGQRVHTGESEELNRQFTQSFTKHFPELCKKYPIYAEMRNLFDLALVGALIRSEDLANKTGWHFTYFGNPNEYITASAEPPKQVETVINHRVINGIHVVAGVSGGVLCQPLALVSSQAIKLESSASLGQQKSAAGPKQLPLDAWWWD